MSILIGHASIDERGKGRGGAAGDQTGKEVCIRTWYDKGWAYVLRCKDPEKAEKMASSCEQACQNENIGYDMNQRNTLNTEAKKVGYILSAIKKKCETDCSALMTVCAQSVKINVPYSGTNAPTTSTMKTAFMSTGEFECLTGSKYLTSDKYLKRGDILVKPGSHTVMALQNGSNVKNEHQASSYSRTQFIKEVQAAIGAKQDGIAGSETLSKTITVSAIKNQRHAVVRPVQSYLLSQLYRVGAVDGIAGSKFTSAVKAYQKDHGCVADGEITAKKNTWKSLLGMI